MEKNGSCMETRMEKKRGAGEIDSRIIAFIRRHHVMTLATCVEDGGNAGDDGVRGGSGSACGGGVWCANIFYAYMPADNLFVFTSDRQTRHGSQMECNPRVAASIVLETKMVGLVRGLQMVGVAKRSEGARSGTGKVQGAGEQQPEDGLLDKARRAYLRRFPYAALADLELWTLRPTCLKMTDNRLGFGKKLIWETDGTY